MSQSTVEPPPRAEDRIRFAWQTFQRQVNLHLRSRYLVGRMESTRGELQRFLLFIGYSRSGSTLLASLLNAHPEVAIAHELDVCWYLQRGISRRRLLALLMDRHSWFASRGWSWTGYDYQVSGTHQGTYTRLKVLGDKRARGTAVALGTDPGLLAKVRQSAAVPVRFIHQVRNPFDNITTMARRNEYPVEVASNRYFELAEHVASVRDRLAGDELLDVWLEGLIEEPQQVLEGCFRFLDLEVDPSILDACAASLFSSPKRTRDEVSWPPDLIRRVESRMKEFPWLDRYSWES